MFECVSHRLHVRDCGGHIFDMWCLCVLDMHRLLAMRCRYLRIVIEAGTTYVVAARVRVGYETCVAAVELVACFRTLSIVRLRRRAATYCTCEICIDISCALYYFSLERLISI